MMVLENVDLPKCAAYASVCREWQWWFEKRNFSTLKITQLDILALRKIMTRSRLLFLNKLTMTIRLLPYAAWCPGQMVESENELKCKDRITQGSLVRLFQAMSCWTTKHAHKIDLAIGVMSPSDHIVYRYPSHFTSRTRLLGTPHLDLIRPVLHPPLSKVDIVKSLQLPSAFARTLPRLGSIVGALPSLQTLHCEVHRPLMLDDVYVMNFANALEALPDTVQNVTVFEQCNEALNYGLKSIPNRERAMMRFFSAAQCLNLRKMNLSFFTKAETFFDSIGFDFVDEHRGLYFEPCGWENLEQLTLTSPLLSKGTQPSKKHELHCAAAGAVEYMPKLRHMQIWWAKRDDGCVFKWSMTKFTAAIQLLSSSGHVLSSDVIDAWRIASNGRELSHSSEKIKKTIMSQGSILPLLTYDTSLVLPESLKDMVGDANLKTKLRAIDDRRRP